MFSTLKHGIPLLTDRGRRCQDSKGIRRRLPELKAGIRDHVQYGRAIALEAIPEVLGKRVGWRQTTAPATVINTVPMSNFLKELMYLSFVYLEADLGVDNCLRRPPHHSLISEWHR